MIDCDKLKKAFNDFIGNYDMNNNLIKLKYYHTYRVADLAKEIAVSLNLNDEEISLAYLIGFLHDIGRFEQMKQCHNMKSYNTLDHGDLGVSMLFDDKLIRSFIETDKYDDVIKKVIQCHNKANIPDEYNETETLYSKIIRDADKIDILYILSIGELKIDITDENINEEIKTYLSHEKLITYDLIKTNIDMLILELALVYDLNFPHSCDILRKKDYIGIIIDSLDLKKEENKEFFSNLKEQINKYLDIRKKEYYVRYKI
jgi:HD superfamily phosphohydrolase YqeK